MGFQDATVLQEKEKRCVATFILLVRSMKADHLFFGLPQSHNQMNTTHVRAEHVDGILQASHEHLPSMRSANSFRSVLVKESG